MAATASTPLLGPCFWPHNDKDRAMVPEASAAGLRTPHEEQSMFALLTAVIGFLATLVLVIVLMNELMPRAFAEWQRGSRNCLVLVGFLIFVIAWIGAYIGYRLGT